VFLGVFEIVRHHFWYLRGCRYFIVRSNRIHCFPRFFEEEETMRSKHQYYSLSDALVPPARNGTFYVFTDSWWIVVDDAVVKYRGVSWQCNKIKRIVEILAQRHKNSSVVFFPILYVPFNDF
jgi:hypothetical protein